MTDNIYSLTLALALVALPIGLFAQSNVAETRSVQELAADRPIGLALRPSVNYSSASGLNGAGLDSGNLAVLRSDLELGYSWRDQGSMVSVQAMYENAYYNFSNLNGPQPFGSTVNGLGTSATAVFPVDGNWGMFVLGSAQTTADSRGSFGRGFEFSGGLGGSYQFSPELQVRAGVMVGSRLEDSLSVIPIIAIDWKITDRLRLQTANGARLSYALTNDNTHSVEGSVSYNRQAFSTGPNHVAISERWYAAGVGYTWRPRRDIFVRPFVEVQFDRRWSEMSNGVTLSSFKANTSLGGGLQGGITW